MVMRKKNELVLFKLLVIGVSVICSYIYAHNNSRGKPGPDVSFFHLNGTLSACPVEGCATCGSGGGERGGQSAHSHGTESAAAVPRGLCKPSNNDGDEGDA